MLTPVHLVRIKQILITLPGFHNEKFAEIAEECKSLSPAGRCGAIVVDEMDIDEGIYWRPDGTIVGVEDLDTIEVEIAALDAVLKNDQTDSPLKKQRVAKKVLQMVFKSFVEDYQTFFGYFNVCELQGSILYKLLQEATGRLATTGLRVISWCGDNLSVNQSCWQYVIDNKLESTNPFTGDPLWILADLPHTLKTTRNAIEKSRDNGPKRLLRRHCFLTWNQLENLLEIESKRTEGKAGFRVTKLTNAHLNLTPFSR
jgi:hypothetical protein